MSAQELTPAGIGELCHRARRTLLDPIAWWISKRALRRQLGANDVDSIIRATNEYTGRGFYARIAAMQDMREFADVVRVIERLQPRIIIEIGTRSGGTLFGWVRASRAAELVISIDLPDGRFGGGYDRRRVRLYREFAADRPRTKMLMIRADSHAASTLHDVKAALEGRAVDFLFIDGDHTYKGVRADFEMYGSLVAPGGLIAFHDIRTHGNQREVCRFWTELKMSHSCKEIAYKTDHLGIGLLHKVKS